MNDIDEKIYLALLKLIKKKEKINISKIARVSSVDRSSIYYRLNKF